MLSNLRSVSVRWLHASSSNMAKIRKKDLPVLPPEETGWAYNHIEKKKGLYKPQHSIEEQIAYMKSRAYEDAYKGLPVHRWYKRNVKGQAVFAPPPRMFCLDKYGRFNRGNPCPICRDEYLFFDYRNPSLIEQFLSDGTHEPIDVHKSGLCREQYAMLKAQLLKAKEHGTIVFAVDFRNYDYRQWYKDWTKEPGPPVERGGLRFEEFHPDPLVLFPEHKRDRNNDWDEWWLRYDKFAMKGK